MTPAPTVAELNAVRADSLAGFIEFILALPASHEAAIFYASLVAMAFGFFASWWVKYSMAGTVDDSLVSYFFRVHTRRTMGVVGTYIGGVALAIATGVFDNAGVFVGWYNVLWTCIGTAMAADGTMNKGTQGAWTPAQRTAEREKIAAIEVEAQK